MNNEMDNKWIKKYIDLMLADDVENAIPLKLDHFPKSFFKFRQLNDYTLESLEYKEFWLAEVDSLNDPFECSLTLNNNESLRKYFSNIDFQTGFKMKFGIEITEQEISEINKSQEPYKTYSKICADKGIVLSLSPEKQHDLIINRMSQILNDAKKNIRICSFSERNDSLLMWSHYANQHFGICIEYDLESLDEIRVFLQPAHYTNELFQIQTMEDLNSTSHIMASLTKSKDWEYESEWRITFPPTKNGIRTKVAAPIPKAIYLGTRFNLNNDYKKKQLMRICESQNIPIYQMKMHSTEYKLIKSKF